MKRVPAGPEHTNRRRPRADELARLPRPRKVSRSEATNDAVLDAQSSGHPAWAGVGSSAVLRTASSTLNRSRLTSKLATTRSIVCAVASSNRRSTRYTAAPPLRYGPPDINRCGVGGKVFHESGARGCTRAVRRSAGLGGPPESREAVGCRKASPPGTPPATETPSPQHHTAALKSHPEETTHDTNHH